MNHDETPTGRPRPPKAEPMSAPTEAELSGIAREAVRQPADPQLDRELARMGVTDAPEPSDPQSGPQTSRPVVSDAKLERLGHDLVRLRTIIWDLVAAIVVPALAVVVLLVR